MANTKQDEKVPLTPEQAISLLADGEYVHNFKQGGFALIGCDYSRADAVDALNAAESIELAGPAAMSMKHPIAMWEEGRGVSFFEADMERVAAFIEQAPA